MKFEGGTSSVISTGTKTILLNDDTINIDEVFFSTEEPDDNASVGWSNITSNYTRNPLYNDSSTSYALRHYKNVGGVKTLILSINIPSTGFDEAGELTMTINTVVGTPKLYFLVKGT
jgi:hypothetical protein